MYRPLGSQAVLRAVVLERLKGSSRVVAAAAAARLAGAEQVGRRGGAGCVPRRVVARVQGPVATAQQRPEDRDAGQDDAHAGLEAREDVGLRYRVGDVVVVHGLESLDPDRADDAGSAANGL